MTSKTGEGGIQRQTYTVPEAGALLGLSKNAAYGPRSEASCPP